MQASFSEPAFSSYFSFRLLRSEASRAWNLDPCKWFCLQMKNFILQSCSLLGHAAPAVCPAADPAARGVASVGIIFPLPPQFFSSYLTVSVLFQHIQPFRHPSQPLPRGQASHNSRLSKYAQWKLWASWSSSSSSSWVTSPCQPRLLHLSVGSFSTSFLLSCPGNTILFRFLAWHASHTSQSSLGGGDCCSNLLDQALVWWGPYPFETWKIVKHLGSHTASLRKNMSLFSERTQALPELPPWLFSLLHFPVPW